jgi:hypothetical protein
MGDVKIARDHLMVIGTEEAIGVKSFRVDHSTENSILTRSGILDYFLIIPTSH